MKFHTQPSHTGSGKVMSAVVVDLGDPKAVDKITLSITNNPPVATGAVLKGTLTQTAVAGKATFHDLSIVKLGHGYQFMATCHGKPDVASSPFDIK